MNDGMRLNQGRKLRLKLMKIEKKMKTLQPIFNHTLNKVESIQIISDTVNILTNLNAPKVFL